MKIEERLIRRHAEDIVYVGNIIRSLMRTETWGMLKFVTASRRVDEIEKARNGVGAPISADRVLGRIEAYESILGDLEAIAVQAEELQKPIESKSKDNEEGAEEIVRQDDVIEPIPFQYGGAV